MGLYYAPIFILVEREILSINSVLLTSFLPCILFLKGCVEVCKRDYCHTFAGKNVSSICVLFLSIKM